jgi:glycogen debranching enzyme
MNDPAVHRQPWLHELSICVDGNITAVSAPSGDIEPRGGHGFYADDIRVLNLLRVRVSGEAPSPVASGASGARAEFFLSARNLGNAGPDPTVEIRRTRQLRAGALVEEVCVSSRAEKAVTGTLTVELGADGVGIGEVKSGHTEAAQVAARVEDGERVRFVLERHSTAVDLTPRPRSLSTTPSGHAVAVYDLEIEPGESALVQVRAAVVRLAPSQLDADPGSDAITWSGVRVRANDARVQRLFDRALDDLRHLLLRDPESREDVFPAAGTPWYLTLFGRDSIWASRMMLPFGTELAAGTLRALARRQGTKPDENSAEAPGKIPHELRRTAYHDQESGLALPPVYYGTVDATALWVTLLGEAWQWGLPDATVRELVPALRAAVRWLTTEGAPDSDGFLKYLDTSGSGLANQGWKDSGDSIRWRNGRIADAPIALVEAQAYAVEALAHAARLFRAFGGGGNEAAQAEEAAAALRTRIGDAFWVSTDAGRYLALALDASGAAVDGLASNMGHVLGTGVLTDEQSFLVAKALTGEELLDEFGVRTLGTGNGGFNPIGYHTGSIWTHDTAIAAWGLARDGHRAQSCAVAQALLNSAEAFDYRWPELYSGQPMMGRPSPYPASCRPQAWSAASAGTLVTVALGLRADAQANTLRVAPARPAPFGALRVEGLRFRGSTFAVDVDDEGATTVTGLPDDVDLIVE